MAGFPDHGQAGNHAAPEFRPFRPVEGIPGQSLGERPQARRRAVHSAGRVISSTTYTGIVLPGTGGVSVGQLCFWCQSIDPYQQVIQSSEVSLGTESWAPYCEALMVNQSKEKGYEVKILYLVFVVDNDVSLCFFCRWLCHGT
jgi:hypothetical protein